MIMLLLFLISLPAMGIEMPATPVPVFLKFGYSSVLEFDESPRQVVLGDSQAFQVEKLNSSIVIRPLTGEYTSNMFVYFINQDPRLFILTVSEDNEPTLYRKFVSAKKIAATQVKKTKPKARYKRRTWLVSSNFDGKKDYLTLEIAMSADSTAPIKPEWELVRLNHGKKLIKPAKLWAERKIVQKDSKVSARFVFQRPDVPRNLENALLLIPLDGFKTPVKLALGKGGQ